METTLNTERDEDFTWEPNNEEEAEIAQLQTLFENEAAVRAARAAIARYSGPSAEECDECGEPIPEARRTAIPGVRLCVDCKELGERRR